MKKSNSWRTSTAFGRVCCQLGSIRLAIPVMTVVTGAMIWGTWIESTTSGENARARVYGAGWFIALMILVCVILTAAVITRYPWKRKHTGFMVVHASLIALIAGGFWSLFERVEGQLWLQEGTSGNILETSKLQIERLNQLNGQLAPGDFAIIDPATESASIGSVNVRIVGSWANSAEHRDIVNDGANPLEAIEVMTDPNAAEGLWIGQTLDGQPWPRLQSLQLRVMPLGQTYTPPDAAATGSGDYSFVINGVRQSVPEVGQELIPGWTVESIRRFRHATVTAEGMSEGTSDHENPAIEVVLNDGKGTLERHVAYKNFPDMKIHRPIQGEADSGVSLEAPATGGGERLVFESIEGKLRATHVAPSGEVNVIPQTGDLPWTVVFGDRSLTIRQHFDHARASTHFIEAPASDRSRPAILVRVEGGADEDIPLLWKNPTSVASASGVQVLKYGPHAVPLPFTIQLIEFSKLDYPGTANAMAYESDVIVSPSHKVDRLKLTSGEVVEGKIVEETSETIRLQIEGSISVSSFDKVSIESIVRNTEMHRIYMNNPYKGAGWKVYQSGFDGDAISVFSIMKDPGLPLTYVGCFGLCVGIFLTFYAGGLSWGHPGIPVPFTRREKPNALQTVSTGHSSDSNDSVRTAVDRHDRLDADSARGPDDAGGHIRQGSGGEANGTVEVVPKARI